MQTTSQNEIWLAQIFAAKVVLSRGVVRRKISDVDRKIGRARLELEVRRRGFHLLECGTQYVIICDPAALKIVC